MLGSERSLHAAGVADDGVAGRVGRHSPSADDIQGRVVRMRKKLRGCSSWLRIAGAIVVRIDHKPRTDVQTAQEEDPPEKLQRRVDKMQHVEIRQQLVQGVRHADDRRNEIGATRYSPNPLTVLPFIGAEQQKS